MNSNKLLHTQLLRTPLTHPSFRISRPFQPVYPKLSPIIRPIRSSSSSSSNDGDSVPRASPLPPPDTVEIRFRRGSRKRQIQQSEEQPKKMAAPPKSWEEMSMSEKAIELYMGEKGALYWLNKFAYASIFIIIGGWILFRFVGPSLSLYQLDTPPLSPDAIFKG